jgi:hypothetical protein
VDGLAVAKAKAQQLQGGVFAGDVANGKGLIERCVQ